MSNFYPSLALFWLVVLTTKRKLLKKSISSTLVNKPTKKMMTDIFFSQSRNGFCRDSLANDECKTPSIICKPRQKHHEVEGNNSANQVVLYSRDLESEARRSLVSPPAVGWCVLQQLLFSVLVQKVPEAESKRELSLSLTDDSFSPKFVLIVVFLFLFFSIVFWNIHSQEAKLEHV